MLIDDGTGHTLRIASVIGVGAYSTVFKAYRIRSSALHDCLREKDAGDVHSGSLSSSKGEGGEVVALKEIPLNANVDDVEWVLKEASLLSSLLHPNVVRYITSFTHRGLTGHGSGGSPSATSASLSALPSLCIVQEFIKGFPISAYLERCAAQHQRIPEVHIASVLYDALQGLLYIHEDSKMVHRDIKSMNLVVSPEERCVKICDLGASGEVLSSDHKRMTVIGTMGWIAPEVLESGTLDSRSGQPISHGQPSDVWSLGVSALEMAVLRPLLPNMTFNEYVKEMSMLPCSTHPGTASNRRSFLNLKEKVGSEELGDFIACCLRRVPEQRLTVRQLLEHGFIAAHNVSDEAVRVASIAAISQFMEDTDPGSAPKVVPETNQPCPRESLPLSPLRDSLFNPRAPAPVEHGAYHWKAPSHLKDMLSSEPFRHLPSFSKPAGLGVVPPAAGSPSPRPQATQNVKQLFDSVFLPASVESQSAVQRVFDSQRRIIQLQSSTSAAASADAYTLEELACQTLTFKEHLRLHDKLLRSLRTACAAIPNFGETFCESFANALQSSEIDVAALACCVRYFEKLRTEPLTHSHRALPCAGNDVPPASSAHHPPWGDDDAAAPTRAVGLPHPKVASVSGPRSPSSATRRAQAAAQANVDSPGRGRVQTPAPGHSSTANAPHVNGGARLTFHFQEDWRKAPRMPQCGPVIAAQESRQGPTKAVQDAATPPRGSPVRRYVDPGPYLYNKWLADMQSRVFDNHRN